MLCYNKSLYKYANIFNQTATPSQSLFVNESLYFSLLLLLYISLLLYDDDDPLLLYDKSLNDVSLSNGHVLPKMSAEMMMAQIGSASLQP